MAEQTLKKVEEQLSCPICLDIYTNPKLLQCMHSYCHDCLVRLVHQDHRRNLGITCPACRQVTPIEGSVANLKPAFLINSLLELQKTAARAAPTDENPVNKIGYCFDHRDKTLKLYCETCEKLICKRCALFGDHHNCQYSELSYAYVKYKEEVTPSLKSLEKQVEILEEALRVFDLRREEISHQRTATTGNICATFRRIQESLDTRKTELINQLDKMTEHKLKNLAVQRDQIEFRLAQLISCLHFMKGSLTSGNVDDVMMMKANTVEKARELTIPFQQDFLIPSEEADIVFSALTDMTATCQSYGQVCTCAPSSVDPTQCYTTCTEAVVVGQKSTALLQAINLEGRPCEEHIQSLEVKFLSQITGIGVNCNIERSGKSVYKISYQPITKGRHQLYIKAEGQHIQGSPFQVLVKPSVEYLCTPLRSIGGVRTPRGVAINQRGEVVVSEIHSCCVSVLSTNGERLLSFGDQRQFSNLRGVAVDGEGNILVADSGNHRIQKFTAEGQLLVAVGTEGNGELEFSSPTGIAVSSNNMIYVAEWANHRVQVLNSDLTFSSTFGREGSGNGEFKRPWGIAFDSTGNVYVADSFNNRIQVFTAKGKFLRMFGKDGKGSGELSEPVGIAIDASDKVYVSEGTNCRISVFTSEGLYVTSFGKQGEGPGEFMYPNGLAIDNCGVVYVCDVSNDKVELV